MSAFTPGPWRALKNGIITSDDCQIGRVGSYDDNELLPFSKDRWDADAKLIAAAPNLADQLRKCVNMLRSLAGDIEDGIASSLAHKVIQAIDNTEEPARAALAKAGL